MELLQVLAEQLQDNVEDNYLTSLQMTGRQASFYMSYYCNDLSVDRSGLPESQADDVEDFFLDGYAGNIHLCITLSTDDKNIDKRTKPWRNLMTDYCVGNFLDMLDTMYSDVDVDVSIQPKF